ncbi:unnamed protein product [Cyclocybe aegerita]|uniref:TPR-like protein n=1 Tax=Cyclocybe aegerita TaxID=1973307 RepID=A0A8S0W478_CYCAE|nr:unnamed protein product [Cyclocybe aegerita]
MALPMLVGGSDCGPSNPLQGLSKRFDHDRGLQQDHFGAGRAGPSRDAFRTQQGSSSQDQDAARFFSGNATPAPQFTADPAFDLASMRAALPVSPVTAPLMQQNPLASWAADFMAQAAPMGAPQQLHGPANMDLQIDAKPTHVASPVSPQGGMQWTAAMPNYRMNSMPTFAPQMPIQHQLHQQSAVSNKRISWDKEFTAQELHLASTSSTIMQEPQKSDVDGSQQPAAHEGDELARTAGMLLENVKHEQNPKFQNSAFMGLMRQLRDGNVTIEGNEMVESGGRAGASSTSGDVKGKGRALDPTPRPMTSAYSPATGSGVLLGQHQVARPQAAQGLNQEQEQEQEQTGVQEDANDAYFRQENADFIRYWNDTKVPKEPSQTAETMFWDKLQSDWDNFEATATGVTPASRYQFQANNPYLLGDSSRTTQHHLMHTGGQGRQSVMESVLELEAGVQRNMHDAGAWYELGVKQQENEREHKALQALQRAVELDPSHLPAWLALAISNTNDNDRQGTYDAIYEWVSRNGVYADAVTRFRALNGDRDSEDVRSLSLAERYGQLIQCLITMARSAETGDVDADIQIALAVLLNTNEEYEKAQDCFRTALAVRPDDWLLYNRVGATMANSGRAEEALEYYYRALELNPGYIRARFNLGISCINLRRYEEAAQHILDALVLQDNDGLGDDVSLNEKRADISTALWDTLKTTCLHMQRADLATLCDLKDLEGFRNRFP